jgi:hypothetical protein
VLQCETLNQYSYENPQKKCILAQGNTERRHMTRNTEQLFFEVLVLESGGMAN